MKLPTLYKRTKTDKIQVWTIETDGDSIITTQGQEGGKTQTSIKDAKGKNIGKANETTPEEQAELQALSMWKKKIDKGYFESAEEAQKTQVFLPMLAADFEKHKKKVKYPAYIQPKLDGVRCLAYWTDTGVKLMSRGGKEWNVPHLSKALEDIIRKGIVLDGEIYIHGATFQQVTKLVKKHRPGQSENLQLWVYDTFLVDDLDQTFDNRLEYLDRLDVLNKSKSIVVPPTQIVDSEALAYDIQKEYLEEGYEGAILREKDLRYELGHRSNKLLKIKSFSDGEYTIYGYTEGEGKFKGCVIWICMTENGQKFKVVPKGTLEEKKEWFKEARDQIGCWLKVKYFELTDDGIPRFPVGLGIREPEDM